MVNYVAEEGIAPLPVQFIQKKKDFVSVIS